ncbi:hypothetical protein BCR43DRAFT_497555 [Syncephalastrum racemosum]|uniref:AN1-type domain-containing protein n=1 Tax=Syncephalastrum racemosum TaxID=13706 RepID=A0A1X2H2D8_SYNRA|nr:hypothetical protein BCR43DRAFT_497555 [Syncephalastrum racemosum]
MELPDVGKHCASAECRTLDFLPFVCPSCQKTFCRDHRLASQHACADWTRDSQLGQCQECLQFVQSPRAKNGLFAWSPTETLSRHQASACKEYIFSTTSTPKPSCALPNCTELKHKAVQPVICPECHQPFCLLHRHASDHQCPGLHKPDPKEERRRAAQEKLHKTMPNISKPTSPAKTARPKPSKKVQEMKMKMSAKPLHTVPLAARLYLYAVWEAREEPVYCSKDIRVGQLLDMLATRCGVTNDNHRLPDNDPKRLTLCKEDQVLDPAAVVHTVLENVDVVTLKRNASPA